MTHKMETARSPALWGNGSWPRQLQPALGTERLTPGGSDGERVTEHEADRRYRSQEHHARGVATAEEAEDGKEGEQVEERRAYGVSPPQFREGSVPTRRAARGEAERARHDAFGSEDRREERPVDLELEGDVGRGEDDDGPGDEVSESHDRIGPS